MRERETDRQTDKQRETQRKRDRDRQRERERERDKDGDRETERDRERDRQETDRQRATERTTRTSPHKQTDSCRTNSTPTNRNQSGRCHSTVPTCQHVRHGRADLLLPRCLEQPRLSGTARSGFQPA